jgi:hypothetical protein
MAEEPVISMMRGWYIKRGSLYFETAQRFIARITDTGK